MGRGTVFWHLLEIASRDQESFLHKASPGLPLSLVAMLSQFCDRSFGIPLSLPHCLVIYQISTMTEPSVPRQAAGRLGSEKAMPIRADRPWQILTEVGVGPCPTENATRPMEKVSHPGDGHFWYLRCAICEREEALRLPTYTKGGKAR
jgi:hypothetical protein